MRRPYGTGKRRLRNPGSSIRNSNDDFVDKFSKLSFEEQMKWCDQRWLTADLHEILQLGANCIDPPFLGSGRKLK